MSSRAAALEDVSRFCDVTQRLAVLPPSAAVRGLYFRSLEKVVAAAGHGDVYHRLFPERFSAIPWYPAHELLVRLVVGGGLLAGAERVHEGMFQIGRQNATAVSDSLLGRAMLRMLSRDPKRLLQQALAGRRQSYTFGQWELVLGERSAVISMTDEYMYIESYLAGAALGTFEAVGIRATVETKLETPFRGLHQLSW